MAENYGPASPPETAGQTTKPGEVPDYAPVGPPGMSIKDIQARNRQYWDTPGGDAYPNK